MTEKTASPRMDGRDGDGDRVVEGKKVVLFSGGAG
jgi:hypothetical protein